MKTHLLMSSMVSMESHGWVLVESQSLPLIKERLLMRTVIQVTVLMSTDLPLLVIGESCESLSDWENCCSFFEAD